MKTATFEIDGEPSRQLLDIEGVSRMPIWPKPPSVRWLRELVKRKSIPFIKVGGRYFFDPPEVENHLRVKLARKART